MVKIENNTSYASLIKTLANEGIIDETSKNNRGNLHKLLNLAGPTILGVDLSQLFNNKQIEVGSSQVDESTRKKLYHLLSYWALATELGLLKNDDGLDCEIRVTRNGKLTNLSKGINTLKRKLKDKIDNKEYKIDTDIENMDLNELKNLLKKFRTDFSDIIQENTDENNVISLLSDIISLYEKVQRYFDKKNLKGIVKELKRIKLPDFNKINIPENQDENENSNLNDIINSTYTQLKRLKTSKVPRIFKKEVEEIKKYKKSALDRINEVRKLIKKYSPILELEEFNSDQGNNLDSKYVEYVSSIEKILISYLRKEAKKLIGTQQGQNGLRRIRITKQHIINMLHGNKNDLPENLKNLNIDRIIKKDNILKELYNIYSKMQEIEKKELELSLIKEISNSDNLKRVQIKKRRNASLEDVLEETTEKIMPFKIPKIIDDKIYKETKEAIKLFLRVKYIQTNITDGKYKNALEGVNDKIWKKAEEVWKKNYGTYTGGKIQTIKNVINALYEWAKKQMDAKIDEYNSMIRELKRSYERKVKGEKIKLMKELYKIREKFYKDLDKKKEKIYKHIQSINECINEIDSKKSEIENMKQQLDKISIYKEKIKELREKSAIEVYKIALSIFKHSEN